MLGSRVHCQFKRESRTHSLKVLKVCLVVQGITVEEGADLLSVHVHLSALHVRLGAMAGATAVQRQSASANGLHVHAAGMTQACVQACCCAGLPEDVGPVRVLIKPLAGVEEKDGMCTRC